MTKKNFVFTLLNMLLTDGVSINALPVKRCISYLVEEEDVEEHEIIVNAWKYGSLPTKTEFLNLIPLSLIQSLLISTSQFIEPWYKEWAQEAYINRFSNRNTVMSD